MEARTMRVLVIDEDVSAGKDAGRVLETLGCESCAVRNAQQAWRMLDRSRLDAVLVSVTLPEMQSSRFVEALRADPRGAHVPVVVMAATPKTAVEAIRAGARAVTRKPLDTAGVVACLPEVLRARGRRRTSRD
jgi:two-component system, cell cycle response regulator